MNIFAYYYHKHLIFVIQLIFSTVQTKLYDCRMSNMVTKTKTHVSTIKLRSDNTTLHNYNANEFMSSYFVVVQQTLICFNL